MSGISKHDLYTVVTAHRGSSEAEESFASLTKHINHCITVL